MNDIAQLLQAHFAALDAARERVQRPLEYHFVGKIVAGEAAYIRRGDVKVIRQGDPIPAGSKFYAPSSYVLKLGFQSRTVKTGPNVYRWQEDINEQGV